MSVPKRFPLSGSDYFQLLLDYHMRRHSRVGNVVRLRIDFDTLLDADVLRGWLSANIQLKAIGSFQPAQKFFQMPYWHAADGTVSIVFHMHHDLTDQEFETKILNRDIAPTAAPLLHFDFITYSGKSTLVISAHHVLTDQRGLINIVNLLHDLKNGASLVFPTKKIPGFLKQMTDTVVSTLFIFKSHPRSLATLAKQRRGTVSPVKFRLIKFTNEETITIDKNAIEHGASLLKGPFFLAATTMGMNQVLQARKTKDVVYWIPVPQDQRLRGTAGSLLTNQLSFLFFIISSDNLHTLHETTWLFTAQMKDQIKKSIPARYSNLMTFFRRLPLSVYLKMISLPSGGAISSFTYSDLGETGSEFGSLMGAEVNDIINYPPVPYPPGLTIVFMRFKGALRIVIGFVEEAISSLEIDSFEKSVRQNLLGNISCVDKN